MTLVAMRMVVEMAVAEMNNDDGNDAAVRGHGNSTDDTN